MTDPVEVSPGLPVEKVDAPVIDDAEPADANVQHLATEEDVEAQE